jgi:hypothetical protein
MVGLEVHRVNVRIPSRVNQHQGIASIAPFAKSFELLDVLWKENMHNFTPNLGLCLPIRFHNDKRPSADPNEALELGGERDEIEAGLWASHLEDASSAGLGDSANALALGHFRKL